MNLRSFKKFVAGIGDNAAAVVGFFRQIRHHGVLSARPMIKLASVRAKFIAACLAGLATFPAFTANAFSPTNYFNANGTEYAVVGAMPGDQVYPDAAVSPTGGFVVWQDNVTDGDSSGISARQVNSTLSGTLGTFRVNAIGAGSQENPRVALLKNGGAVVVWQGGKPSYQRIYARFLTSSNTFLAASEVQVNTFNSNFQINPAVCVLTNGNVVVLWGSFDQAGPNSFQDVYGQILSPTGQKIGSEFLVNQQTTFNQRSPAVAALPNGNFVATWISEQQRVPAQVFQTNTVGTYTTSATSVNPSVDVYARTFNSSGTPLNGEALVNTSLNSCASPSIAVATDGSYLIAWAASDRTTASNSFDIFGSTFNSGGVTNAPVFRINSFLYGDQYTPRISAIGFDFLVTWTSLAQDGNREGVYGRFVHNNGSLTGAEFRVNTTTVGQQMHPVSASDGANQFIVVWTGFNGLTNKFDLYGQRYVNVVASLQAMPAPYVWVPFVLSNNVYQPRLVVSWAPLLGLSVSNFEIYVDGAASPTALVSSNGLAISNVWVMTAANGLSTNSTHSFAMDYVLADGRRAPLSPSAVGKTWSGSNWGGIPYEWMAAHFGGYANGVYTTTFWPVASTPVANKTTLLSIFVSGGDPLDPSTWLKQQLTPTPQGLFLTWNTTAGATYQVQVTTNLKTWTNVGSPRFAAGTSDSIYVGGSPVGYYRVMLMR